MRTVVYIYSLSDPTQLGLFNRPYEELAGMLIGASCVSDALKSKRTQGTHYQCLQGTHHILTLFSALQAFHIHQSGTPTACLFNCTVR